MPILSNRFLIWACPRRSFLQLLQNIGISDHNFVLNIFKLRPNATIVTKINMIMLKTSTVGSLNLKVPILGALPLLVLIPTL